MTSPGALDSRPGRHRFPRRARLKRQRLIAPLFRRGEVPTLAAGALRVLFRVVPKSELPGGGPVQVAFIPGRRPTAVERNRVRRALREVYRVHAHELVDLFSHSAQGLTLALMYRGRSARPFAEVQRDLPSLLGRLCARLRTEDSRNPSLA